MLGSLLIVAGIWAGALWLSYQRAAAQIEQLMDAHLAQSAGLLLSQLNDDLDDDDLDLSAFRMRAPLAVQVAYQVFDEDELLIRSSNAPRQAMSRRQGFDHVEIDGSVWRVFTQRHPYEDELSLSIAEHADARADLLDAIMRTQFWPMLIALPIVGILLLLLINRGFKPLQRVADELAARRPDQLTSIQLAVPSELAPVIERINGLFSQINAMLTRERRFTADAAHELKTPLAGIKAQLQVAERLSVTGGNTAEPINKALRATNHTIALSEKLLTLSKLDAGAFSLTMQPVSPIIEAVVDELDYERQSHDAQIKTQLDPSIELPIEPTLFAAMVRNLIVNAWRHNQTPVTVNIVLSTRPDGVQLTIGDDGQGVSNEEIEHLTERFYRVNHDQAATSGLGLSIVAGIASLHQAALTFRQSDTAGLEVGLYFQAKCDSALHQPLCN